MVYFKPGLFKLSKVFCCFIRVYQYQEIPQQICYLSLHSRSVILQEYETKVVPTSMLSAFSCHLAISLSSYAFISINLFVFKTLFNLPQALWHVSTYFECGN